MNWLAINLIVLTKSHRNHSFVLESCWNRQRSVEIDQDQVEFDHTMVEVDLLALRGLVFVAYSVHKNARFCLKIIFLVMFMSSLG